MKSQDSRFYLLTYQEATIFIVLEIIAPGNKKVLASQTLYKFINLVPKLIIY